MKSKIGFGRDPVLQVQANHLCQSWASEGDMGHEHEEAK